MRPLFLIHILLFSFNLSAQNTTGKRERFNNLFIEGVKEYVLHNYERSLDLFTETLNYTDTVPAVYFYLALNHYHLNDETAARINIQKAARMRPDNEIFRQTADTLFLDNKPGNPETTNAVEKKDTPANEAETFLKTLQRLTPQQRYEQGKKLLEKYPFNPHLTYTVAQAAYNLKKYDEARQWLINGMDFAMADKKLLKKYYLLLASIAQATGKTEEARKWKQKAAQI